MRSRPQKRRFWKAWPELDERNCEVAAFQFSSSRPCAGTHHPWRVLLSKASATSCKRESAPYGSPAYAGTTTEYTSAFSRQHAPEFCKFVGPQKIEGAGKTGCALHPRSRVPMHKAKNAHEHTGSAEAVRPSLRNGFTAYFVLSPARPELVCHRRQRDAKHHRQLDTGHWGVRTTRLCRTRHALFVKSASASTASHRAFRDVRNAPLVGWDGHRSEADLPSRSSLIAATHWHDGQIKKCCQAFFSRQVACGATAPLEQANRSASNHNTPDRTSSQLR